VQRVDVDAQPGRISGRHAVVVFPALLAHASRRQKGEG
jgi:hypothetical protein